LTSSLAIIMQASVFSIATLASLLPMAMAACGAGEIGMSSRKKKKEENNLHYRIVPS